MKKKKKENGYMAVVLRSILVESLNLKEGQSRPGNGFGFSCISGAWNGCTLLYLALKYGSEQKLHFFSKIS